jgi:hypothetical protein
MPDATDIIAEHWPYDGPHNRDTVHSAAEAISGLVRYMNNATGPWNARNTLVYASDVDRILANLHGAVDLLPQLINQLRGFIADHSEAGEFYDDQERGNPDRGVETAAELVDALGEVRSALGLLSIGLTSARRASNRLGNNDDTGPGTP